MIYNPDLNFSKWRCCLSKVEISVRTSFDLRTTIKSHVKVSIFQTRPSLWYENAKLMNAYERETNWRRQTHILMIFGLDSKEGKVGLLERFQVCLTKWHVKGKRNIFTTRTHADVNTTPFLTWITNAPVNKLYISGLILKMYDSLMTFLWFVHIDLNEYSNH